MTHKFEERPGSLALTSMGGVAIEEGGDGALDGGPCNNTAGRDKIQSLSPHETLT
jgi:hypothetical protein